MAAWLQWQIDCLKHMWGRHSATYIAPIVRHSAKAVKSKAKALGITRSRRWSAAHDQVLREQYRKRPASAIASDLGRKVHQVYNRAFRLGLQTPFRYSQEVIDGVRRLHAEGLDDRQIAQRLGIDRRSCNHLRNRLGLPVNAAAVLAARRRGVEAQRRVLGIRHGGDLRRLGYRRFAAERGWPEDLRPRAVQILELLAVAGALDRWQIAEKIGWNVDRSVRDQVHGQRHLLASNDAEGSYLAHLLKRGLVCYQARYQPVPGRRGYPKKLPGLYMLTPIALDTVIQRTTSCAKTGS